MTTLASRSQKIALKEESSEGVYTAETAGGDFITPREGISVTPAMESVTSDALTGGIGSSAPFTTKEVPTASIPQHVKHSGVEGTAPDWGILLKSLLGEETVQANEHSTTTGSSAGTATARAVVNLASGGATHNVGESILIKDPTNGYSIRPVHSISTNALTLGFNLGTAPATDLGVGKPVHYSPVNSDHPTLTMHRFQSGSASGLHEAVAGCRVTDGSFTFTANQLATCDLSIQGLKYYRNPIVVTAGTNDDIDFTDDDGTNACVVPPGVYKTPKALADAIKAAMDDVSTDTFTVTFSNTTGKFTILSNGTTFSLLWDTGAGNATSIGTTLGFLVAADDTGATTYTSDNEITYNPAAAAAPDSQDPLVVKKNEVVLGSFNRFVCRKASDVTLSISNTRADVDDICEDTGASGSLFTNRQVSFAITMVYEKHEVDEIDKLLNNTDTQLLLNFGSKDASGNWVPGTCISVWIPQAKLTANPISETDSYLVMSVEGTAYQSATQDDVHLTFL